MRKSSTTDTYKDLLESIQSHITTCVYNMWVEIRHTQKKRRKI